MTTGIHPHQQQLHRCGRTLSNVIEGLIHAHSSLLEALQRQVAAMRSADGDAVEASTQEQQVLMQEIVQLDTQRQRVVANLAGMIGVSEHEPNLTALLGRVGEPVRAQCLALCVQLKNLITEVRHAAAVVHEIGVALSGHVETLIQRITFQASQNGTYGRDGRVQTVPLRARQLDVQQ